MNDKDIWEMRLDNPSMASEFETKPGPPLTEKQIENRLKDIKEKKQIDRIEKLEEQVKDLIEQINTLKNTTRRIIFKEKKNVSINNSNREIIENENQITKK